MIREVDPASLECKPGEHDYVPEMTRKVAHFDGHGWGTMSYLRCTLCGKLDQKKFLPMPAKTTKVKISTPEKSHA